LFPLPQRKTAPDRCYTGRAKTKKFVTSVGPVHDDSEGVPHMKLFETVSFFGQLGDFGDESGLMSKTNLYSVESCKTNQAL